MLAFMESLVRQITPNALLDIGITALFIYSLFSLIRGTRAVTLVVGVSVLLGIYALAQFLDLRLFTQLLQAGAFVGVFALVVIFQPELRRALERIGRVGTFGWLVPASSHRRSEQVARAIAKAAAVLSAEGHGALIVIERETGLEDTAESGVMLHADLTAELLLTIFMPRTALHDGAVIVRGESVLAAGALLPLTEMRLSERFGTRHRAALGITEDTDAVAVVVSEESGHMSVVERARIVRVPTEGQLERALVGLLETHEVGSGFSLGRRGGSATPRRPGTRLRIARRSAARPEALPPELITNEAHQVDEITGPDPIEVPAPEPTPAADAAPPADGEPATIGEEPAGLEPKPEPAHEGRLPAVALAAEDRAPGEPAA
jgi:diadenylate cyclase